MNALVIDDDQPIRRRIIVGDMGDRGLVQPVLQDERVTSYEAKSRLWSRGKSVKESRREVDSEAAAIILADLIDRLSPRP